MDDISPSDLKTILHSKRANLYYLQHCRVLVNGGRVEYVTDAGKQSLYWNIPIANTTTILLGTGTSITQAAMRELAKAGVLVGFCGGGGTPLFSANEMDVEVAWFAPQSEYRPTEYLQKWVKFWFDDDKRLEAAKAFQLARLQRIRQGWLNSRALNDAGFQVDAAALEHALDASQRAIVAAPDNTFLLTEEARLSKQLFALAARAVSYGDFTRAKKGSGSDPANRFLDHGNYLAYGLAASATWVLGIPHGLAVLHGKTRRGGLVFDVADLVKDATILPQAFVSAVRGDEEQEFRQACIENLTRGESLDFMIDTLKAVAERRGERTWQTPITQAGLDTLRKLLKKSARRNTAVACHWIRGKDHSELLWIVGDASRFNAQGAVPTNSTRRDVLRKDDENDWHSAEDIKLLAQMAALFHDIGKANAAFQAKLRDKGPLADAYRHEWVSLRLFEAFVGSGASDGDWLQRLIDGDEHWFDRLRADHPQAQPSPFAKQHLPPLAQMIGWLIVSHHRLPSSEIGAAGLKRLPSPISADWCGARQDANVQDKAACWQFAPGHLPFASTAWRKRVAVCAQAMLERPGLLHSAQERLSDPYLLHLSRLVLMLADHHYSSLPSDARLGDKAFPAHANTDNNGALKQRLDEHLLGVAQGARRIVGLLPRLERSLPRIARHKGFKRRATDERFRWQDKAFDLASSLREASARQGFFGINLASTGCGKTLANGRILYALADPQRGARFSIALGLRTLTLQTGEAYREKLGLDEDDLAIRVGGTAVRELFELGAREQRAAAQGSESAASLLDNGHVHYEANLEDGPLKNWLQHDPLAHKLVSAPVLACTVDHLIPACESTRGGRQIAPMLRLLTSDLMLDEPDDFDLADLPALTRLVHWAGLLGSRVLLSSATLPPALLRALFEAYSAGRAAYRQHRGEPGTSADICCAWFDEFTCSATQHADADAFAEQHATFIAQRLQHLSKQPVRRRARIVPVSVSSKERAAICAELAQQLPGWMSDLHQRQHSTADDGRRVSFGLLRLANIDPLIELAQALHAQGAPEGMRLHLCVYHSRFPLLLRSAIERQLDALLRRHNPQAVFDQPTVRDALARYPEADHLFVVLASPVAEVGRDHDYDWAVVEPSSMRSIIQLAGRIRRHRPGACEGDNLYLLSHNIKALQGEAQAFTRPGFESERLRLASHDLAELLPAEALAIDAAPRIVEASPLQPKNRLVDLEHARLRAELLGEGASNVEFCAAHWWRTPAPLSGVLQHQQRFRKGRPQLTYALLPERDDELPCTFQRDEEDGTWRHLDKNLLSELPLHYGPRIHRWGHNGYEAELAALAELKGLSLRTCAMRYGPISLDCQRNDSGTLTDQAWRWHEALGFTRER